ncbi:LysR substrate-binding domain-containing protein [Frigidibacter oleivorans]|uniref:LysR substrate-binding domain-containing protein n=1 Tax=Frigidibacter oleivorans TaxID=2487129 RepID=UPI000F8DBBC1|nr:LysR substrate-binding domain-containing protein [Frigidibacter oleivorans]
MRHKADLISQKMRLRQLRCFVTAARMKSVGAAADKLGLTQPSVSRSIRELEQVLGHDLFDRSMRGAELTRRGRDFLEAAEAGLLQIWQGTRAAIGDVGAQEVVRIGALPNVCSRMLPSLIASFKVQMPGVRVVINPGPNAVLLGALRHGETDIVIGRLSSSEEMRGLVFEALYDEPLVFVVRASHPLAHKSPSLQDVLDYPMLLPPEGTIIRQEVSRFLAGQGVGGLPNVIETTSSDFQRAYLAITESVAIIPQGVVQREIESGDLVDLGIGGRGLVGPVGLTTNPDVKLSGAVAMMVQHVRRHPFHTGTGM